MKKLELRNIHIEIVDFDISDDLASLNTFNEHATPTLISSTTLRLYENPLLNLFHNLDESIYLSLEEKRKQ
jgi:hypothetical protein